MITQKIIYKRAIERKSPTSYRIYHFLFSGSARPAQVLYPYLITWRYSIFQHTYLYTFIKCKYEYVLEYIFLEPFITTLEKYQILKKSIYRMKQNTYESSMNRMYPWSCGEKGNMKRRRKFSCPNKKDLTQLKLYFS